MEERLCIYTAQEGHGVEIGRSALAVCELQHQACRSTPIFVDVDQRLLPSERAKERGHLSLGTGLRRGLIDLCAVAPVLGSELHHRSMELRGNS